jgi:hypothetical protein
MDTIHATVEYTFVNTYTHTHISLIVEREGCALSGDETAGTDDAEKDVP